MKTETKKKLIELINNARGDDLARAKMAFRNLSEEQMKLPHGQSGKTRQEVLDEYIQYDAHMKGLIAEVENA